MAERQEKGSILADIPDHAVEDALRSVERATRGEAPPAGEAPEGGVAVEVEAPAAGASGAEVESLKALLELSQTKARETLERLKDEHDRLLRAVADLENYKKRAAREREDIQKFGVERLVKDLLPAIDNLDRALVAATDGDPLADGVKLVRTALEQALARHGVKGFSAMGAVFDPASHEALMQVPTAEQPAGTVVLEHARGWRLHERLVRPAMVGVAVAPPPAAAGEGGTSGG